MTTARELVTKSLRRAGITGANETPTATEINDGLDALNNMIGMWANDGLLVFARTEENFPLTGASEYTVGTGQTFNTTPFVQIISAYVRQGTTDYYLSDLTDSDYAKIPIKGLQGIPEFYSYNNGFPVARIKFDPVPSSGTLYILSEKPLSTLTLNTVIQLPPGWEKALIDNLAVDQAPDYQVDIPQSLERAALMSKASIKRQVAKSRTMDWNKTNNGYRNIYSGWV